MGAEAGLAQPTALRWPASGQIWRVLGYVLIAIAVVLVGLPMYWMLIAAFKTNQEIFTAPPTWIPLAPTLDNFPAAWRQAPFGNFYVNSLIYTLVSGSAKILQAVFSAYWRWSAGPIRTRVCCCRGSSPRSARSCCASTS